MKASTKALLLAMATFVVVLFGNIILGGFVGLIIPGGDDFINSYFHPLYFGVCLLIALVVGCSYLIIHKLNELMKKLDDK